MCGWLLGAPLLIRSFYHRTGNHADGRGGCLAAAAANLVAQDAAATTPRISAAGCAVAALAAAGLAHIRCGILHAAGEPARRAARPTSRGHILHIRPLARLAMLLAPRADINSAICIFMGLPREFSPMGGEIRVSP
ncbi:hypothetical protein LP420_28360 [Massilia sp. B-10]|nr:hypothetical protein LP420_28360 [Massilia sp. B-10]